jgi:hypothetical protein
MFKPDQADQILNDRHTAVVAMVRSGAKHKCGVQLSQEQCQTLEVVLKRSVDLSPLMEAVSKILRETVIAWRKK